MIYFGSDYSDNKIKIDENKDVAYIKSGDKEVQATSNSKVVADITIEGKRISEKEYNA